MGLTLAHPSLNIPDPAQRKMQTKQNTGSVYVKEKLELKNRFDTLSRLVNVES
ncbi:hypothetical protein Bca4012_038836 [Brassica carinata]|uniref:Uncharacterized protein n=1 Tax=Brassica carinata TaxID=52824 RepID=A0A8X8B7J0_BRACI|nr:hypothetical protein Bca52824_007050 [Brassica carinata]